MAKWAKSRCLPAGCREESNGLKRPPSVGWIGGRISWLADLSDLVIYRAERMAQRSGKSGAISVVIRYWAPADPPVPTFVPIVRCTILTWR